MIKHYLKNAYKAFFRNKFIAFINIFGISFTLLLATVIFSFVDLKWGTDQPNKNKYLMVDIDLMGIRALMVDTVYNVDSSVINEMVIYDTIDYKLEKGDQYSSSNSNVSFSMIQNNLSNLRTPANMTFYSASEYDIFLSAGKITARVLYTDHNYWSIYNFQLVKGGFFNETDVTAVESNVVITEKFALKHFGNIDVIGQIVNFDNKNFTVIGVVQSPRDYNFDCYLAYTHMPNYVLENKNYLGNFIVSYLLEDKKDEKNLKDELDVIAQNLDPYEEYNDFSFYAVTFAQRFAWRLLEAEKEDIEKAEGQMWFRLSLFGLFMIMLPVLNLLNINLSRIMERRSEIGIRKSFGATKWDIFIQFLMENILLSLFSGVIALLGAKLVISWINSTEILGGRILEVNWSIIMFGIVVSFIFGILFGVLPALRLSKLNIVESIKS